jgi:hypothetical protein
MAIIINEECLKIPIYFNNKIDEESIRDEFEADLRYLLDNEKDIIKRFK